MTDASNIILFNSQPLLSKMLTLAKVYETGFLFLQDT